MKFGWTELFSRLTGEEPTEEEKNRLEEAIGDALGSLSFEDVASSVKEDYPNATEEDLRQAITMKEDGYEINYGELPPQPFKEDLQQWKEAGIDKVDILSQRSPDTCEVCREADREIYTIEEALEEMPLPHDECSCESKVLKTASGRELDEERRCLCTYTPVE